MSNGENPKPPAARPVIDWLSLSLAALVLLVTVVFGGMEIVDTIREEIRTTRSELLEQINNTNKRIDDLLLSDRDGGRDRRSDGSDR